MGKYDCWGDDREDLTEQVRLKVLIRGTNTLRSSGSEVLRMEVPGRDRQNDSGHWRVTGVKCSKGHENSFEGYGVP